MSAARKKEYVVGFMFDANGDVLLQRKKRPDWMKDKLNGPGGLMYDHETPEWAIAREFSEETGISTVADDWTRFATMIASDANVHFLMTRHEHGEYVDRNVGDRERTYTVDPGALLAYRTVYDSEDRMNLLPIKNLTWLIPLALDESVYKPVLFGKKDF